MARQFIIDTMLGKLAKWLRVMGYDAHYKLYYKHGELCQFIKTGRLLLSRDRKIIKKYQNSIFIKSDHVGEQLREVKGKGLIAEGGAGCFLRCLICNTLLEEIELEKVPEGIPDYVFNQNNKRFKYCRSCGKYFWPGTHRDRMIHQLYAWGFNLGLQQK